MRWTGHAARMGEVTNACNILAGITEETTWRCRWKWEDNIAIDLKKIWCEYTGFNWLRVSLLAGIS
jgi:hypothetical protein